MRRLKIIEIGRHLQKLLQKVYCHVFYGPQCISVTVVYIQLHHNEMSVKLSEFHNVDTGSTDCQTQPNEAGESNARFLPGNESTTLFESRIGMHSFADDQPIVHCINTPTSHRQI